MGPGTVSLEKRFGWLSHPRLGGPDPLTRPGLPLVWGASPPAQVSSSFDLWTWQETSIQKAKKPSTDRASNLLDIAIPKTHLLESCLPSSVAARVSSFRPCRLPFGPFLWHAGPSISVFWVFTLGFWTFHSQGSTSLLGSSLVLLASLTLALRYYALPPQRGKHYGCEKLRVFLGSRPARCSSTSCRLLAQRLQMASRR